MLEPDRPIRQNSSQAVVTSATVIPYYSIG
jgi:hypothetical protein